MKPSLTALQFTPGARQVRLFTSLKSVGKNPVVLPFKYVFGRKFKIAPFFSWFFCIFLMNTVKQQLCFYCVPIVLQNLHTLLRGARLQKH